MPPRAAEEFLEGARHGPLAGAAGEYKRAVVKGKAIGPMET